MLPCKSFKATQNTYYSLDKNLKNKSGITFISSIIIIILTITNIFVTDKFKKPNLNCSKLFSIKITLLMLTGNNFNTLIIPCGSGNLSRTNGKNAVIIDMTRVLNLFLSNKFKNAVP